MVMCYEENSQTHFKKKLLQNEIVLILYIFLRYVII